MGDIRPARPMRPRCRARLWGLILGGLLLLRPAVAGAADPLITILKNMLLGGAVGTILGGSVTLVVREDSRADAVRWGAVIGVFGGFTVGVLLALRGEEGLFGSAAIEPSMPPTPRDDAPAALRGDDAHVEFVLLRLTGATAGAGRRN